jgi:hypothetical protein
MNELPYEGVALSMTKDVKLTQRGADILISTLRVDLYLNRVPLYRPVRSGAQ